MDTNQPPNQIHANEQKIIKKRQISYTLNMIHLQYVWYTQYGISVNSSSCGVKTIQCITTCDRDLQCVEEPNIIWWKTYIV